VVLGMNQPPPEGASNRLARYLRNDPDDPEHDPDRSQDPGAHTYNGKPYDEVEAGGPVWMTNVEAAVGDRNTTLSITLDGMPNKAGERGNWNTPETIVEAFQQAVRDGRGFSKDLNNLPVGAGTAWEMSVVALNVRMHEGGIALGEPESELLGRSWDSINWYSGNEKIDVPRPDIPELAPPPKPNKR
jgi:hypothetical protein